MKEKGAILLVGGTGFIGRALAARLHQEGHEVHVLGRRPAKGLPGGVLVHSGDQADKALIRPLLERCAAVVHLAAATVPADTVWQPVAEAQASLMPALGFLECIQDFPGCRCLLISSGGALYGATAEGAAEDLRLAPTSYYGAGKVALESFFQVFGQRQPGCLSILRPSNVYGPGQPLRGGFGVIRTLLERARTDGKVEVFGDGTSLRDYLFIDDMVAACLAALDAPTVTCNVGSGQGVSLLELIAVVERVTGKRLAVEYRPARASDVSRIVLDPQRATERLGWTPGVSLEEGIRRTWLSLV